MLITITIVIIIRYNNIHYNIMYAEFAFCRYLTIYQQYMNEINELFFSTVVAVSLLHECLVPSKCIP